MNIPGFLSAKKAGKQLVLLTCYDTFTSALMEKSGIDAVLVGDSVSMVLYGMKSTVGATVGMIEAHVRAVREGSETLCVIADMPFLSTRLGLSESVAECGKMIVAGANAVKIEGLEGHEKLIPALVGGGVPVMGHLGLTPQSVNTLGGYRQRGREPSEAEKIVEDAQKLQELGCFSLVLECVPSALSERISDSLDIPVIGIGAGPHCDGQILVLHDMLGLTMGKKPSFVREYLNGADLFSGAISRYADDVRNGVFPPESKAHDTRGELPYSTSRSKEHENPTPEVK